MKKLNLTSILLFLFISFSLSGCDLIIDIFEAGFWLGIIVLLIVVGIIIWLVSRFMG